MKILYYISLLTLLLSTVSCNDWLDVQPRNQTAADELFDTYEGFADALNGCYMKLKSRNLYGEKLTMSDIECFANMWYVYYSSDLLNEITDLKYKNDNVKARIAEIYLEMYNIIAQTNMIIANMADKGSVISDPAVRAMIEGEAYAIRAFCHFDILRLFGQLPRNATINVSLPYAEKVDAFDYPQYYNFAAFFEKVIGDLDKAESLLKDNDPIFRYTFPQLNSFSESTDLKDSFLAYRQFHFNYWAVKAVKARALLYSGREDDLSKAYEIAGDIYAAKGANGERLLKLSGSQDLSAGYNACPSEGLLLLNVYNLMNYSPYVLAMGLNQVKQDNLSIDPDMLDDMFYDQSPASNNRVRFVWGILRDTWDDECSVLRKYYYTVTEADDQNILMTKKQVVPLIRLSEIYLMIMELTTDLDEGNRLYIEYMESHDVQATPFNSLGALKSWVESEYAREFFGEGHMFYYYKRTNSPVRMWDEPITEAEYIVPLPDTEYDPS